MHEKLLVAPNYKKFSSPSIFLGGPIQQAPKWQDEAIEIIHGIDPNIWLANPRRSIDKEGNFSDEKYLGQVGWERFHLKKAGYKGCIMFYIPQKIAVNPDREYGQTTRWEGGTWATRNMYDGANIVIGTDGSSSGMKYVRTILPEDCPNVHSVFDSLEETCKEAVRLARNPRKLTPKEAMIRALMENPEAADRLLQAVRYRRSNTRRLDYDEFDRVPWEKLGLGKFLS